MANATNLAVEVEKTFEKKLPVIAPPSSPVTFTIKLILTVKGKCGPKDANNKLRISPGKVESEVEASVETEFCDVKFIGKVEPGKLSKLSIEIGGQGFPLTVELAANADYTQPISFNLKWKHPIQFANLELKHSVSSLGPGYLISGTLDVKAEIVLNMNTTWPGWAPILSRAYKASSAVRTGVSAVRGALLAGEVGQASAAAVAATAVGAAVCGMVWTSFGLYSCGKALREGRGMAARYAFSNGYARMLAELTANSPNVSQGEGIALLAIRWEQDLAKRTAEYVNGGNVQLIKSFEELGKAAIVHDVDRFIKSKGRSAWDLVCRKHQQSLGGSTAARSGRYLDILYKQAQRRDDKIGIPFQ